MKKTVSYLGCHNTESHSIVFLQSHRHYFRILPHWLWRESRQVSYLREKEFLFSPFLRAASGARSPSKLRDEEEVVADGELGRFHRCWFSENRRPQRGTAGAGDESRMKATCVGSRARRASADSLTHEPGLRERESFPQRGNEPSTFL